MKKKIDWEQRRYELVRSALSGCIYGISTMVWEYPNPEDMFVKRAVKVADAAIAILREVLPEDRELYEAIMTPIEELVLPVRILNRLVAEGMRTVGDVASRSRYEWLGVRGMSEKSVDALEASIADYGLVLGTDVDAIIISNHGVATP